ncbi:hypothetical protein HG535_0B01400 [Zygotorulaspora mrakii]|uniref:Uncharacterized protein n=1 Tax=Zygotorulaspora mrakii TaxID=42260 RepID=A0A7H9AZP9_ZYGMR|nr:uncharacterized protein HG535_0B01400 [Zygotorulaspora mrakii]QLG71102.1 hypothetical protein HG535_0B01400 [Zygotorulaspora mrakii]
MFLQGAKVCTRSVPISAGLRAFGSSPCAGFPGRKVHQDAAEQKEQKLFDKNKAKLEKMEHHEGSDKRDSRSKLKKRGDDARIEQNRPDDGVY